MGLVTNNAINPLSTIATSPSGFNGAGGTNTYELTVPPGTIAPVILPPIESEGFPALFAIAFQPLSGANSGGGGLVVMYGNTVTAVSATITGNLITAAPTAAAHISVSKASGTKSLQLAFDDEGLTAGALVRVTRIA